MGLIILAAWVATLAIGGVIVASGYFLTPDETSLIKAASGVAVAAIGFLTFFGLIKKKSWALISFIVLGLLSVAQFYYLEFMPLEAPANADWFRLIAAAGIYTMVALYVRKKLNELDKKEIAEMED